MSEKEKAAYIRGLEDSMTILLTKSSFILNELAPSKTENMPEAMIDHLEAKLNVLMESINQLRNMINAVKYISEREEITESE